MAGGERGWAHCRALPVSAGPASGRRRGWGPKGQGQRSIVGEGLRTVTRAPALPDSLTLPSLECPGQFPWCRLSPEPSGTVCVMFDFTNLIRVLSESHDTVVHFLSQRISRLCS